MKKSQFALIIVSVLTLGSCKVTQKRNVSLEKTQETRFAEPKEYK